MKQPEDFKKAATEKGIPFWGCHNCSICKYPCGFVFNQFEGHEVVYDHGCHCTHQKRLTKQTWDNVAQQFNIQRDKKVIKEYHEFWGFDEPRIITL